MSSTIASSTAASNTATSGSTVTSTGIGSGLDVTSIVSTLTTAFGAAANTQLANRKASITAQVSAFGTFSAALSTFQSTLSALSTPTSLANRTATLADSTIATASAKSGATPATYTLGVTNLATAASLSSKAFASASATVGTGALTISVGGKSSTITIDSSGSSLQDIASAINSASDNPGISATILTTSAGARLVLSGNNTGAANAISVSYSGGEGGLSALTYDPNGSTTTNGVTTAGAGNLTQTQAATDANFTINGYPATSASNAVSGVIDDVTINLAKPTATGATTTLTVGNDTSSAATSVDSFVKALNGLITSIQTLTSYDPSSGAAGPLLGNATLQSFQNQLSKILSQVQSGNTGGITSLSDLGITANADGSYTGDDTTLGNQLTSNLSSVASLLGGTNGIATKLNTLVKQYIGTGGLLSSINQGLQTGLSNIASEQTALNARLSVYSATLTKEYNAMDTAVALLKQTQSYLTAQFNAGSSTTSSSVNSSLGSGNVSST